jgi:hypothetical protein
MNLNTIQKKEIKIFLKDDAKEVYFLLKTKRDKDSITLLNSIERTIDILSSNPQYGNPVSKKQFPLILINKYNINNLYRVELSKFWRLLYTIKNDEIYIYLVILKIIDHKEYNKLFKYK